MKNNLIIIINNIIYDELGLETIENELTRNNVFPKQTDEFIKDKLKAKYFFLLNDLSFDRLNKDEIDQINHFYQNGMESELIDTIKTKYLKIIIPDRKEGYFNMFGTSDQYLVPTDAIVLGFNYIRYKEDYDEISDNTNESLIIKELNNIQDVLGPEKGLKIAVLKLDETAILYDNEFEETIQK